MRYFFFLVGLLVAFGFWIFFPKIFKWWVSDYLIDPPISFDAYTALGPIGDIFGGLTALFTSLTLIIVIYSTYLQREANKDARKSMAKQLKQAKKANAEQLDQARESTIQQLKLAQSTHDAQMKELRKSNFDNKFYSLLNYKMQLFNSIKALNPEDGEISGAQVFDRINSFFTRRVLSVRYKTQEDLTQLRNDYYLFLTQLNNQTPLTSIYSYVLIYNSLFILIDSADYLDENEKELYLQLIRNSCLNSEQITIFFISPLYWEIKEIFQGKELFHSFDPRGYHIYARDHFDETYFFWAMHKDLFNDK